MEGLLGSRGVQPGANALDEGDWAAGQNGFPVYLVVLQAWRQPYKTQTRIIDQPVIMGGSDLLSCCCDTGEGTNSGAQCLSEPGHTGTLLTHLGFAIFCRD